MRKVQVLCEERATVLAEQVQVADSGFTRMRGLLGRSSLGSGEGLWIRPSSGVHTFGMAFAIDVVGLDKSMKIVKLWKNLKPQRLTSLSWSMQSVIELPAGCIVANGLEIGDKLSVVEAS